MRKAIRRDCVASSGSALFSRAIKYVFDPEQPFFRIRETIQIQQQQPLVPGSSQYQYKSSDWNEHHFFLLQKKENMDCQNRVVNL